MISKRMRVVGLVLAVMMTLASVVGVSASQFDDEPDMRAFIRSDASQFIILMEMPVTDESTASILYTMIADDAAIEDALDVRVRQTEVASRSDARASGVDDKTVHQVVGTDMQPGYVTVMQGQGTVYLAVLMGVELDPYLDTSTYREVMDEMVMVGALRCDVPTGWIEYDLESGEMQF